MTNELDARLGMLARAPAHPALAGVEAAVLDRIAALEPGGHSAARRAHVAAVAIALTVGIAGGLLPDGAAEARAAPAPFGTSALAPSTLLLGAR